MLPPNERKLIIICASLVVVSLIVLVAILGIRHRHQTGLAKETPSPEASVAAKLSSHPDFEGVDSLLDHGLTSYQMDNIRYSLNQYKEKSGGTVKKVWLNTDTLVAVPTARENSVKSVTFGGNFNDQTAYKAKVDYFDLTATRLYIYDDKDKLLYDSGNVDLYETQ